MKTTDLAPYYIKASATNDFYMWDGLNITLPTNYKGRLLLLGVYDLTKEPKFKPVRLATTTNLDVEFTDAQTAVATEYGVLELDGIEVVQNDRVLIKDQTDTTKNGIYVVTSVGSDNEYYSLKRAVDANSTGTLNAGNFLLVREGETNSNHTYQLVPYDLYKEFGSQSIYFIDLTSEGFYANNMYGIRLLNSVMCNQIEQGSSISQFNYACPNFLNVMSPRLIKALIPYNVSLNSAIDSLLNAQLTFNETKPCNCTY